MAGLRFALLAVAVAVTTAVVTAAVPSLPQACVDDRTTGCCPGLITLLELESAGCDVDAIASASDAKALCDACGEKLSAVAEVYAGETGAACSVVQQHVAMFPFACTSYGAQENCLFSVAQVLNGQVPAATAVASDGFCGAYSCWGSFTRHMRTTSVNIAGQSESSFFNRIGGKQNLYMCAAVDGTQCADTIDSYNLPNPPVALDTALDEAADYCSGCNRVAFSNKVLETDPNVVQYPVEAYRRFALGSCAGGCTQTWLTMTSGQRKLLDLDWVKCDGLFDSESPTCSTECMEFGKLLLDTFGCCTRFGLEQASIEVAARGGTAIGGSDVADFISTYNSMCDGDDLMAACEKDYSLDTTPTMQPSDIFTATVQSTGQMDSHVATAAARIGALPEDFVVEGSELRLVSRTASATAEAGDAFTSIINTGGMVFVSGTDMATVDPACPTADNTIPSYHYIPDIGYVTTDCPTLKAVMQGVDCASPDHVDQFGNNMWVVGDIGAQPCSTSD